MTERNKSLVKVEKQLRRLSGRFTVRDANQIKPSGLSSPNVSQTPSLFGVSISELMAQQDPNDLPFFLLEVVDFLETKGLEQPGIFREPGTAAEIDRLKGMYKTISDTVCLDDQDPKTVASLLKAWFQCMPSPIFPEDFYEKLIRCTELEETARLRMVKHLVSKIPPHNFTVLSYLFKFLNKLSAYSQLNLMTPHNLGIVFGPTLLRPKVETAETLMSQRPSLFCQFVIEHSEEIFPEHSFIAGQNYDRTRRTTTIF